MNFFLRRLIIYGILVDIGKRNVFLITFFGSEKETKR